MKVKEEKQKEKFRRIRLFWWLIPFILVLVLLTQRQNLFLSPFKFNQPKPVVLSSTTLPQNIQQAVENLAKQEIKEEQKNTVQDQNLLQDISDNISEITGSSSVKAKVKARRKEQKAEEDRQLLYEKVQQIVQRIFITKNKTDIEKKLPNNIQQEITKLKNTLPEKNIPKINTPKDVKLPKIARLPNEVEEAIVTLAKDRIKESKKPKEVKLDFSIAAKDLDISEPLVLPDNPLYKLKELLRFVQLAVRVDPISRAEELLSQGNEKTLEAARLIERDQSQKTIALALKTLDSVNSDFNKLKQRTKEFENLRKKEGKRVDKLVDKIIQNGLARQTVFSAIENKVHGEDFVKVEKIRANILKEGVNILLGLTNGDAKRLVDKLEFTFNKTSGSALKGIKAVELLTEISRTQQHSIRLILGASRTKIARNLETTILSLPKDKRIEEVLSYAQNFPGNPVRQFEAYDFLKDNFKNPEIIKLTEGLKDKAVENLRVRISELTNPTARQEFVNEVIGNSPQDLKIALEIEARLATPKNALVQEDPLIKKEIEEIKTEIEKNIIDTYKGNPEELAQTELFTQPSASVDVSDVKVIEELKNILTSSSGAEPAVVQLVIKEEQKIINEFIENVSNSPITALEPTPQTIDDLLVIKNQVSESQQTIIDSAITSEVKIIEDHLANEVNDPSTFENYVSQIENPVVLTNVGTVDSNFNQVLEQKAQEVEGIAQETQTQLQTTVAQVQQEVFESPNVTSTEQSLPQTIQQEVQEIKQEIPVEQIPQVEVQATVSVEPTPAPAPSQEPVAAPASTPALVPVEQPSETSAPAVPSL